MKRLQKSQRGRVTIQNNLVLMEKKQSACTLALLEQVESAMTARVWDLKRVINTNRSICHAAVSLILEHTPQGLQWEEVVGGQFCYTALTQGDGDRYSINISMALSYSMESPQAGCLHPSPVMTSTRSASVALDLVRISFRIRSSGSPCFFRTPSLLLAQG